ncbi:MAG: PspC domain-containing protein [Chloroflexi bacterium]|nr:PspC domain-containing protein [Chloroflexota bacterium]MBP8054995.1 PspC domain-containing protein [Chloroflexota bacterium]
MPSSPLVRSDRDKIVAGVCGGIAEYLEIDSVFVRLALMLLVFASGVGLLLYLVLWLILPTKGNAHLPLANLLTDNLTHAGQTVEESVEQFRRRPNSAGIAAAVLILLGSCFLANNFGLFAWVGLGGLGALILVGAGIYLLFGRK